LTLREHGLADEGVCER
jgi:IS5 family transposase